MDVFRGSLSHYRLQLLIPVLFEGNTWSGRLKLERGPVRRIFHIHGGHLSAEASSLPTEHLSQVLANLNILDPGRSAEAFAAAERTKQAYGEFLLDGGYVERGRLMEALEYKAKEAFFDCYEWESGEFEFRSGAERPAHRLPLKLSLSALHQEALERRREWRAFWELFRARDTRFQVFRERADQPPVGEELELLDLAEFGVPLGELLGQTREGRLSTARRALRLYRRGALIPIAGDGLRDGGASAAVQLLKVAHSRFQEGRYEEAADICGQVLEQAPVPEAHVLFRAAEEHAQRRISEEVKDWEGRLKVLPLRSPFPSGITSDELYLHVRLQSGQPVLDLLRTAPMGELAAYRALRRLVHAGALELEGERNPAEQTLSYGRGGLS